MLMLGKGATGLFPLPQQEVESRRHPSSVPQLEVPPAPPHGTPADGGDPTEMMTVAVRAVAQSLWRSKSQKDGSPDPSLMMPLAVVISTGAVGLIPLPQQKMESRRHPSSVPQLEVPPCTTTGHPS
jgi:hypothetical protein